VPGICCWLSLKPIFADLQLCFTAVKRICTYKSFPQLRVDFAATKNDLLGSCRNFYWVVDLYMFIIHWNSTLLYAFKMIWFITNGLYWNCSLVLLQYGVGLRHCSIDVLILAYVFSLDSSTFYGLCVYIFFLRFLALSYPKFRSAILHSPMCLSFSA